jgi:hypothetical protein
MACTGQRPHGGRDAVLVHSRLLLLQLVEAARVLTGHLAAAAAEPVQQAAAQPLGRPSLPGLPAAEGAHSRADARAGAPPELLADTGRQPAPAEALAETPAPVQAEPQLAASRVTGAEPRGELPEAAQASTDSGARCRGPEQPAPAGQAEAQPAVRC